MDRFEDRVAAYPGRWKLAKADGTEELATLTRADEPVKEGTKLNAATFNQMIDEIENSKTKRELLWQNANPAAAFGAQTIQLGVDLSAYDYVHIIVTGVSVSDTSLLVEPGGAFTFTTGAPSTQSTTQATPYVITRSGNVSDRAIQFGACMQGQNGTYTFNATNRMIPTKIYGIKL